MASTAGSTGGKSRHVSRPLHNVEPDLINRRSVTRAVRVDPFLRWLAVDPALAGADRPLDVIVERLARSLGAQSAYVARLLQPSARSTRLVAIWKDDGQVERAESSVSGRPCELVLKGRACYVSRQLGQLFAQLEFHTAAGFEAYAAQPLVRFDGVVIGHYAVVGRVPFKEPLRVRRVLAAVAPRVAAEVDRLTRMTGPVQGASLIDAAKEQSSDSSRASDLLLREAHHRVKNNLQVAASILAMQAGAATSQVVTGALTEARTRISTIALLHAQLSESSSSNCVDLKPYLQSVASAARQALGGSRVGVTLQLRLNNVRLAPGVAMACGLLVNELVGNAYQHAFAVAGVGSVEVYVNVDGDRVRVGVRDNGSGLSTAEPGTQHLGLRLVHLLATRQLAGHLQVDRGGTGTDISVTFSRSAPASADYEAAQHHHSGDDHA